MRHRERHRSHRIGWLRAAVLGANDGIVSTASLLLGVAASGASTHAVLASGAAGLVAGAMSMAAGEYVSVSSQADAEHADVEREKMELATNEDAEKRELAKIYVERGLTKDLARRVAEELMAHDAIGAHARDELGISEMTTARPVQAALASAGTFAVGAALPLAVAALAPPLVVAGASLACLGALGGIAANAGGASVAKGAIRVLVWGALAMAATSGIGELFGAAVT